MNKLMLPETPLSIFLEEIHTLVGTRLDDLGIGAPNILKPGLACGKLQVMESQKLKNIANISKSIQLWNNSSSP